MNKKLLAVAVTSALAGASAGVNADTANVNVYGKLYLQAETVSGKGATQAGGASGDIINTLGPDIVSQQQIDDPNSYVGFKGEDNVGGGMKGWFQVESALKADVGTGTWAFRNSAVGLSGGFGNVFLGNWDTVYKQLADPIGFLGISSGNFVATSNVLAKPAISKTGNKASFHTRQTNNLEYDTPTMGGFTVMLEYSPDESRTAANGFSSGLNVYLRDIGVKFEQGPLYVALANEFHHDFFGASTSSTQTAFTNVPNANDTQGFHSKDTATRLTAMYKLPSDTTVSIDVAQMEYKEEGGAVNHFDTYKHKAVALVASQKLGNITLAANYVTADKGTCTLVGGTSCDTSGLDGKMMSLGAAYAFSKRTSVYAIYSKITNGENAQFNNTLNSTVNPGVDPQEFGIGITVSF